MRRMKTRRVYAVKQMRTGSRDKFQCDGADCIWYCADPKYIRLMDRLVAEYPEVYKVTAVTDVSKTYSMPKAYLKIGKPRRVSAENVERARERLEKYNLSRQLRQENKEP